MQLDSSGSSGFLEERYNLLAQICGDGQFRAGNNQAQSLGQTGRRAPIPARSDALQWRAEQSLGQTGSARRYTSSGRRPSMEGRAIARPNAAHPTARLRPMFVPSMEGRAIARPNAGSGDVEAAAQGVLQWRAEQSLGQTRAPAMWRRRRRASFNGGPSNRSAKRGLRRCGGGGAGRPSMEGRAIARPNEFERLQERLEDLHLQWRAEQSLGQTRLAGADRETVALLLQWRAEQSLGQTDVTSSVEYSRWILQWRAEQSLGQTALAAGGSCRRSPAFNGGPSNRSAKPGSPTCASR